MSPSYPPFKTLDGALMRFTPHQMPCCFNYMFSAMLCECLGAAVMEIKVADDEETNYGHKATMCGGLAPMSPCPLCVCCGFGPLAAKWAFKKDPSDASGNTYMAVGSAFAGGCCVMCTNHDGDKFTYDADHLNTLEKPGYITAGMNPLKPPCVARSKALKFYRVADRKGAPYESSAGGAPVFGTMDR